jgi:hypothetical protein
MVPPSTWRAIGSMDFHVEPAQLAYHIVEEMGARLTSRKTVVKGRLELPQFLHESFHIAGDKVKGGDGKAYAVGPTGW